jgi:hypothetical protein
MPILHTLRKKDLLLADRGLVRRLQFDLEREKGGNGLSALPGSQPRRLVEAPYVVADQTDLSFVFEETTKVLHCDCVAVEVATGSARYYVLVDSQLFENAPFFSGRTRGALGLGEPAAPEAGAPAGWGGGPPPLRVIRWVAGASPAPRAGGGASP